MPRSAEFAASEGVTFHTDAAQAVGKIEIDVRQLPVDFLSFTGHKIYGPKGAGALYVAAGSPTLQAVTFGGGQERGLRPGTLATHQIVGLGPPVIGRETAAGKPCVWPACATAFGQALRLGWGAPQWRGCARVPGILNVSFEGVEGESLVLVSAELAVSTGSACNSASAEPSYVLAALGRDTQLAQSSLRFSLGRFTTDEDVDTGDCCGETRGLCVCGRFLQRRTTSALVGRGRSERRGRRPGTGHLDSLPPARRQTTL